MYQEQYVRAGAYALIAQLFSGVPDAGFLRLFSYENADGDDDNPLQLAPLELEPEGYEAALRRFQLACSKPDLEVVAREYNNLFGPGGLLVSAGASASAPQLSALRQHLVACGLAIPASTITVEFYVSGICGVMRALIEQEKPADVQAAFFDEFVYTSVMAVCEAIEGSAASTFYSAAADLARAFMEAEKAAFDEQDAH